MRLVQRARRVYWIKAAKGGKDLLILDAGHPGGEVHVYEHKESISVAKIGAEVAKQFKVKKLHELQEPEAVRIWAEGKGSTLYWKLGSQ